MKHKDYTRFLTKVNKDGPNGCWEWTAGLNENGYGQFWLVNINRPAHVESFRHFKGQTNNDLFILHSCNNRKCVNPDHLREGTKSENSIEAAQRGNINTQKLSIEDVKFIKTKLAEGESVDVLAKVCNVAKSTVKSIKSGQNWSHV